MAYVWLAGMQRDRLRGPRAARSPTRGPRSNACRGLLACAAGVALLLANGVARAYCLPTTGNPMPDLSCRISGEVLKWHRSCISYSVLPRPEAEPALDDIRDAVDRCFATWMAVSCDGRAVGLRLAQTDELAACGVPEYNKHGPNANSILFVRDWDARELNPDAIGLTEVAYDEITGEIYDADMQINETRGQLTLCGASCPQGALDLENVVTHEAGHFLGLGHSPAPGATMGPSASPEDTFMRDLTADDRAGLCALYGERATPNCADADFLPRRGFTSACGDDAAAAASPAGCSCSIAGAARARRAGFGSFALIALAVLGRRLRRARASVR